MFDELIGGISCAEYGFKCGVCARLLLTAAAATLSCAYLKCASGNGILDIRVSKKSEVSTLSVNYSIKMGDN